MNLVVDVLSNNLEMLEMSQISHFMQLLPKIYFTGKGLSAQIVTERMRLHFCDLHAGCKR